MSRKLVNLGRQIAGALVRRLLNRSGFAVERLPRPLLETPEAVLRIDLLDVVARRILELGDEPFYFLQIGAFDGVKGDPLHPHVAKYGLRGIVVEPQPRYFAQLAANYANLPGVTCKNVAVADARSQRSLFTVRDGSVSSEWAPQLASFSKEHLLRAGYSDADLATVSVACVTFQDLVDEMPAGRIDLLQIDVESYDYEILRQIDFTCCTPRIIRFEHKCLTKADFESAVRLLRNNGYRMSLETDGDTLACLE